MSKKKITSIGEILLDIYGNHKTIGGAPFNFIYHINKLVGNTNFISAIGNDNEGQKILNFLLDENISTEFISIEQTKPTGKVIVELNEDKVPEYNIKTDVAYDFIELSESKRKKILSESKLIYFGSLCQRYEVSRKSIQSIFSQNSILFCDINIRQNYYSKEIIENSLNACSILKLNEEELKLITELCLDKSESYQNNVKEIIKKYNIPFVSITKGANGAEIFTGKDYVSCKAKNVDVIDTVGAGDAYSAILALGILRNLDIDKTNYLAVSFASEVCNQKGALLKDSNIYNNYYKEILNE
jgi:fructokinase